MILMSERTPCVATTGGEWKIHVLIIQGKQTGRKSAR